MLLFFCCFFFKQKTAYEMCISDWSSDVCSSDLLLKAERLGEKMNVGKALELLSERTFGVAGNADDLDLRALLPEFADQRRPVHARHDDVGNHHIDPLRRSIENLQRHVARRSDERRVGKACVSTGRYRWGPYNQKKQPNDTEK